MMDITSFIDYMLEIICDSIDNTISKYNKLSTSQLNIIDKLQSRGKNSEITVENACKITKSSKEKTRADLNKLTELGYLTKYKQGNINIYKIKIDK